MPIVHAAFGIAGGAAFAQYVTLPTIFFSAAVAAAFIATLLLLQVRTSACVLVSYLSLGLVLGSGSARAVAGDCRLGIADGVAIEAVGRFTTLPDSGARALLHADELRAGGTRCRDV